MWNRFSARLRKIIAVALDEAARCGRRAATAEDIVGCICADEGSGGAILIRRCGADPAIGRQRLGNDAAGEGDPGTRAEALDSSAGLLLEIAAAESQKRTHDWVGTEHVLIAATLLDASPVQKILDDLGIAEPAVAEAARKWIKQGKPRPRGQTSREGIFERFKTGRLGKILRFPELAWKIFVRKSLGHPRFVSNPYPLYRWLRTHEPVRQDPLAPVWILTRYDDVAAMLREPRFRKDPFAAERLPRTVCDQLKIQPGRVETESVSMLFLDPPRHTRVRAALARAFTPATLAALRPKIEAVCRQRLDGVRASGQMDLIADLAYPLPVIVIAELLGFPAEDYEKFKHWSDVMTESLGLNARPDQHAAAGVARDELREYFDEVMVRRQDRPADSLIGRLLESEGKNGGLSLEEIFTNAVLLLAAGHETTTNLIGNGVLALMQNRQQWEQLVSQPALIESAVEEMLRYDSPVQWTSRLTGERIELAGQSIEAGRIILGCVGAANRDPLKFSNPEQFDIRRAENKHISFGTGVHFCIGAALARMEAQTAVSMLVERYPQMRWAGGKLNWMKGLTFRGVKSLPLILR